MKEWVITGVIVRRSCLGKKLSFVDIEPDNPQKERSPGDNNDKDEANNTKNYSSPCMVKVSFRHQSNVWDTSRDATFPIKPSELPFGARVCITVAVSDDDKTTIKPYEVIRWDMLHDPRVEAQHTATQVTGGLSYSSYLRQRGGDFNRTRAKYLPTQVRELTNSTTKQSDVKDNESDVKECERAKEVVTGDGSDKSNSNSDLNNQTSRMADNADTTTSETINTLAHGDKRAKAHRARLLGEFLLDVFGVDALRHGSGVVDVAGGKGHLSVELAVLGHVQCTVVDPLLRRQQLQSTRGFPSKRDAKRIRKARGPLPLHIPLAFHAHDFVPVEGEERTNITDNTVTALTSSALHDVIQNCSCLVGLHPDQCTEDILQVALLYQRPVAIVPCCVFPNLFCKRTLPSGKHVVSYEDFCQYLLQLDSRLQSAVLPFQGRNTVIYATAKDWRRQPPSEQVQQDPP